MTAGTRSYDRFTNLQYGWVGTKGSESWSGADTLILPRTRTPRIKYETTRLVRKRDGKTKVVKYTFSVRNPNAASGLKPKVMFTENNFTKSVVYLQSTRTRVPKGYFTYGEECGSSWFLPNSAVVNLLDANDQNKLINKLWTRVKGSDFNLAVTLGEAPQCLSMIGDTAIRIAKSIWHIRKGDISGSIRSLVEGTSRAPLMKRRLPDSRLYPNLRSDAKSQANLFLEIQYGWRPLIDDTVAAAEMLAHHLEVPRRHVIRVKVEKRRRDLVTSGGYQWTRELSTISYLKAIFAESQVPSMVSMLGLNAPLPVLWELTPFSFVVDRFIPIGQALEARAAAQALTGTFVTSTKSMHITDRPRSVSSYVPYPCSGLERKINFSRSVTTQLKPELPAMVPLNKAISMEFAINAIALLTQIVTKPKASDGSSLQGMSAMNRKVQNSL